MNNFNFVVIYVLWFGDNGLVLVQCLGVWCGYVFEFEIDFVLVNIGFDLFGQVCNFLSYVVEFNGCGDEDMLVFGCDECWFSNLLLVEQLNGNFVDIIVCQFFIDVWYVVLFSWLVNSCDVQLVVIVVKGLKEVCYYQCFSCGWLECFGNGIELLNCKMQQVVDNLWCFIGELFFVDEVEFSLVEQGIVVDLCELQVEW